MIKRRFFWVAMLFLLFVGCGNCEQAPQKQDGDNTLSIVVSIVPQGYFVDRIAGDLATVEVLVPPDHSPATHQATPRQMDVLSRADIYFRIGVPSEIQLIQRLEETCPNLKVVDTREGVAMLGGVCTHDHGDHHHHHEGDDPHIWLDPMRVKIQVRTVAKALSDVAPQHKEVFAENLVRFENDLDDLHGDLTEILAPVKGKVIYVYHPAFGYLADAYGFEQCSIESEGKEPGSKRLYELIDEIKQSGVNAIFEQPQFSEGSVQAIANEANVQVITLDSLMQDYVAGMKTLATAIADGVDGGGSSLSIE